MINLTAGRGGLLVAPAAVGAQDSVKGLVPEASVTDCRENFKRVTSETVSICYLVAGRSV